MVLSRLHGDLYGMFYGVTVSQLSKCGMTVKELEEALKRSENQVLKLSRKNMQLMKINMEVMSRCNDLAISHNEFRKVQPYIKYVMKE